MSRALKITLWSGASLVAILAIVVAVLLNFDWNRAKPWISQRVSDATGRQFAINGDLSLTWHVPQQEALGWRNWIPWPRLNAKDVVFGNPSWAHEPVMARANQVTFSINPLPLLGKKIVIPSLALDAPQLSLERLKDGRNNWTFKKKDEPSAWQLDLQELVLNKGSISLNDAIKRAELRADVDTLGSQTGKDYRLGWRLVGTLNGEQVDGNGKAGSVLSLRKQRAQYPVEADVRVGKTHIRARGTLTDPSKLAALNLRLRIEGASMAHLYPLTNVVLPDTPPFMTEGHLVGEPNAEGGNWTYEKFTGRVGGSDLSGTLRYTVHKPRARLEGAVVSDYLNFKDLSPLIGADSAQSKANRGVKAVQPPDKVLPVENFRTERWTSVDVDVQFSGKKIMREKQLPIDNLVTRIRLQDGELSLAPLKFGIAGGKLVSNIRLDGRKKPVKADLRLTARHLKLKQLFPTIAEMRASLGEINGDASLTANGNSVATLLGSANGEIKAVIDQGTISKLLLEEMGLNVSSIVATQLFGDRQVNLNCAVNDFMVRDGVMQAKVGVIDTDEATIYLNGNIDLSKEQLALAIKPESKGLRLISLRSPLYVSGTFKKPQVGVDKGVVAAKAGSAIVLGALAPVAAALIPLINVGPGEKSECSRLLQVKTKRLQANEGSAEMDSSGK